MKRFCLVSCILLGTLAVGCAKQDEVARSAPSAEFKQAIREKMEREYREAGIDPDTLSESAEPDLPVSAASPDESPGAEFPNEAAPPEIAESPIPNREPAGGAAPLAPGSSGGVFTQRNGFTNVRVFYATDREATGAGGPKEFYGADRAGRVSFGFCNVSVPDTHTTGQLEAPKIWKFEFRETPQKHVVLLSVQPVDGRKFLTTLQQTIRDSVEVTAVDGERREVGGEAFVFVHGYNVTFEDAARRTAQIAFDLRFKGAPIMYSWPSQGRGSLSAYKADGRTAEWCEENVSAFVAAVARESGARKIHLIAHSMGNRVVTGALRRLAFVDNSKVPKFNEVILTAPDIDAETFKDAIAPRIVQVADRVTIYASSNDLALKASGLLNLMEGVRLGQGGANLVTFPQYKQINVIDASAVDTNLFAFGHSYHADNESVLNDIRRVFEGKVAEQRGLVPLVKKAAWKILTGRMAEGQPVNVERQ